MADTGPRRSTDLRSGAGLCRRYYEETYKTSEWDEKSYIRHDGDHHVLLEIKPPGVETPCVAEGGKLSGR